MIADILRVGLTMIALGVPTFIVASHFASPFPNIHNWADCIGGVGVLMVIVGFIFALAGAIAAMWVGL